MTIPSTGPLRPSRPLPPVRRDRRPDWLLGTAGVLTLAVVVVSLLSLTGDHPVTDRTLAVLSLLTALTVLAVIGAFWLLRPKPLPPIEQPSMPTVGPPDRGSVSPERSRGSWPWA